jgi:tetratricopeptide (TPR) repeat protein
VPALSPAPANAPALNARGNAYAALGEWKIALDDLLQAARSPEATPDMLAQLAQLALHLDQAEFYRSVCRTMIINHHGAPGMTIKFVVQTAPYGTTEVSNFRTEFDADSAALMAWTCSLAPGVSVAPAPILGPQIRTTTATRGSTIAATEFIHLSGPNSPFGPVVELAHRAVDANPRDYPRARALGAALYRAGQHEAAVRQLNDAAALRPIPSPSVWLFLALAHHRLGHKDEARRLLEQATKWIEETRQRKPDGSGQLLTWERLPWTERAALDALRREAEKELLGRDDSTAFDAAIEYYKEWIHDEPKNPSPHHNLGVTLLRKGDLANAIAAFRTALQNDNRYVPAHLALGSALLMKGEPKEAVERLREAVKLRGDDPSLWFSLGKACAELGDDGAAADAFREVLRRPAARQSKVFAEAHCELAFALQRQGKPAEGLNILRSGVDVGSKMPGWNYPSDQWLKRAESLAALEKKLPAILKGEKPASPEEALELSALCQARGHPVTAARLTDDALRSKPPLGDDPASRRRYRAACAAAQAGCGKDGESAKLTDTERARWRGQARTWLEADLTFWSRRLEKASAKERGEIASNMQRWQHDPSLAGERDEAALEKLPTEQREGWRRLWREVEKLRRKALGS